MSSIADRNRDLLIERLQGDARLGGGKVLAAATLMRVSIFMLIGAGVLGAIVGQLIFGEGWVQFVVGVAVGYFAYYQFITRTMGPPRVIGVMAVLTDARVVLLGSKKAGVVGDWALDEVESIDLIRKGNLLIMGKVAITPVGGDRSSFFMSNRKMGREFVAKFQELRRHGA